MTYVTDFTLFKLVGCVEGKTLLDVGCGSGRITRLFANQEGISKVVGVDKHEEQIKLAIKEKGDALGADRLSYYTEPALISSSSLNEVYDVVIQTYMLHNAASYAELLAMCKYIYSKLKRGGKFVGLNANMNFTQEWLPRLAKYGFYRYQKEDITDGDTIDFVYKPANEEVLKIVGHYLSPQTYERAFRNAGFEDFKWQNVQLDPNAPDSHYYSDYLSYPDAIAMTASKS
jgi:ubiquinone/menaquinone biosynthesis C-methylase UbiE